MQPKTPKKGIKVTKTESTVIKPVPAKQKYTSLGGEIGRPTGPTTGRRKTTRGGAKSGKTITKAKNGKSFPDLNKDGKITKADILKGRGVIAKNGKPVKKAALGALLPLAMKAAPMIAGMLGGKGKGKSGGMGGMLGGLLGGKNGKTVKKAKSGGSMKKCMQGCK